MSAGGNTRVPYFAYGSNMADLSQLPHVEFLGPARLAGYRLAFTRDSQTWQAGAADVVRADGMCVWGALYNVTSEFLDTTLDRREGAGFAYERTRLPVARDGQELSALTYVVVDKVEPELPPSTEYVERLIDGARRCGLPDNYLRFLESLRDEPSEAFRQGLFALPTSTRREAGGMGLVRVAPRRAEELKLGRLAAVRHGPLACVAKVHRVADVPEDACEVDQNVRHVLGIVGYETYGAKVTLERVAAARFRFVRPLIQPRMLFLRLQRPRWMDSEKSICVLHEKNIRLLGLNEGEYVDVYFTGPADAATAYTIRSGSFRVFSGSTTDQPRGGETIDYPQIDELYLDAYGRAQIGVPKDTVDVPVMVGPDLSRLFSSRLIFYGATVFLAGAALWPLVEELAKLAGLSRSIAVLLTVLLSFGLTAIFALFDIRGRVRY